MRKGPYQLDLRKQLKVRVNNETFEKLAQLSEEDQRTKSSILRGFVCEYPSGQARGWYFSLEITGAKPRIILNVFCSGSGWSA